jgi:hypothetical protein
MITCFRCHELLDESNFHKRKNGHQSMCKECRKSYIKTHYESNKEKYKKNIKEAKLNNAQFIRDLKSTTPCKDCGKVFPYYVMDFDHLTDKKFNIARSVRVKGINQIKEEISKCDIVCSNCHRVRTFSRIVPPGLAPGTAI